MHKTNIDTESTDRNTNITQGNVGGPLLVAYNLDAKAALTQDLWIASAPAQRGDHIARTFGRFYIRCPQR
jgi:hypothetical protein